MWAVEPYFGGSHKYFLRALAERSRHEFTLFTLPGRHWKWRMHGGAVTLAARVASAARQAAQQAAPTVLLATDMLDLATFLSLAGPPLDRTPVLLYFHENQLTYPLPPGVERDLGYALKNITSALAARRVLFNSAYHREEFLDAVVDLLASLPDEVPAWVPHELEAKSAVLPVGCDLRRFERHRETALREAAGGRWGDPSLGPLLLWNQRWEYDKAPERFFEALRVLRKEGVPFRLAMAGPSQGTPTEEFLRAKSDLADRIVHWGRVPGGDGYASLLWAADVVASTAIHEFFGIAVTEAMYCGCRPVLPKRLSYPELIPAEAHEDVLYGEGELAPALARALRRPRAWPEEQQRRWVDRFDWTRLIERYDEQIQGCAGAT